MELGIALPISGKNASPASIAHVARSAEQIGLGSLWVSERLLRPITPVTNQGYTWLFPEDYATVYDPLETLTYVAGITTRIKLGTSVIDALFHTPVVLAKRFATLDQFSAGRVIAGIGQGWMKEEFLSVNIPMKRRGAVFSEFVEVIRAAWGTDPVQFKGRFYEIAASQINPKPMQVAGLPLIFATSSPASLERAARQSDGITLFAFNREDFQKTLIDFRNMAQAAGRDPRKLQVVVPVNAEEITDQAKLDPQRPPLKGSINQIVEDLRWLRTLQVDHVFFDMNGSRAPLDDQLHTMEQLHQSISRE